MGTVRIDTKAHNILREYKQLLAEQGQEGAGFSDVIHYMHAKLKECEEKPAIPDVIESMMSLSELTRLRLKVGDEGYRKIEEYARKRNIRIFDAVIMLAKIGLETTK